MITAEVAKRIWKQLGEGWLWVTIVQTVDAAGLDEVVRQLEERRRAALESLVECEELHAIVSAERAARRYDDAQDPLVGVAEWYRDQKSCLDAAELHHESLVRGIRRLRLTVMTMICDEYDKARRSFVQLRKEQAEREQKESGE